MQNELDIFTILLSSGPIVQGVLILLIFASIFSWAIVFKKKKDFKVIESENQEFLRTFATETSLSKIFEKASSLNFSSFALMYRLGYLELDKIKERLISDQRNSDLGGHIKAHGTDALVRSLRHGVNESNIKLENKLSLLASVGSISPFIGLFGTVWGIINSFTGLASAGAGIEAIAPGIAEALVATAVGLAAAIPATYAYNIFISKVTKINTNMDSFAQEFINLIERTYLIDGQA